MRTPRGALVLAEETHPRRRGRIGRLAVLVSVVLLAVGGWIGAREVRSLLVRSECQATAAGSTDSFSPEQLGNAATITAIAVRRGLPARAATIALATALQESKLRNIGYGDRDSLGLFQQRPSQGWGTPEQIMDPEYSAMRFYDALVKVPGWQTMEITKIAQEVQRSAAPEAYAQHEPQARILASTLAGHSPAAVGCRLVADPVSGKAASLEKTLFTEYGIRPTRSGTTLSIQAPTEVMAWSIAHWSVAKSDGYGVTDVSVAGRTWQRSGQDSALHWGSGADTDALTVLVTLA